MKYPLFVIALMFTLISCQSTEKKDAAETDASAQGLVTTEEAFFDDNGRIVTPETYPRDETSRQLLKNQSIAGVNKLIHKSELTPTDHQPVVRMNRDTYYSMAVIDVSKGASITMPEIPEGKYMSVQPVTEDHRIQAMKYGPGTFELSTHTGTHLYVIIRLDARFTEEEAKAIQAKMVVEANSNNLFTTEPINKQSFIEVENALKARLPALAKREGVNGMRGMFTDPRDASGKYFSDEKYQIGAAIGWGGAQMIDNIYEASGNYSTDSCYQLTFEDPQNTAFWSITVYDEKGFMFNDLANYSSNTATPNEDGTYTISFGCGEEAPNNLAIANPTNVFNITVRHYQPSKRVMEEGYRLVPLMQAVGKQ